MPETLIMVENYLALLYSHNGVVQVNVDVTQQDYLNIIKKQSNSEVNTLNQEKNLYPASLSAAGGGSYLDFSIYLSTELDSRIYPKSENQVAIKFT